MNVKSFLEECSQKFLSGYAIVAFSEACGIDNTGYTILSFDKERALGSMLDNIDVSKLLDIRVFDAQKEYRMFRNNLGSEFQNSRICDGDIDSDYYYDDVYYLDIDDTKSSKFEDDIVYATGGGKYHLPLKKKEDAGIKIRYYYNKDSISGVARMSGYRIVGLEEK